MKREVRRLTELSETLEESVTEHTCVIDLLNASVKQKEQKIATLIADGAEKARAISQKTEEIRLLSQELDAEKARAAAGDEKIGLMIREKEEIESFHRSEIDALRQQVAGLVTQVETARMRITSVQREYEEEKTHGLSLEGTLSEVTAQKEEAERSLSTLVPEHDHLKSAYGEEQARLLSLEGTLSEVTAQKEEAERSLGTLGPEHDHLKSAYGEEQARLLSLEGTLREVTAQKEEAERTLGTLAPEHDHLKSAYRGRTSPAALP